jgi:predicted lipoprotein with Yx(FWY)xxD motif
MHKLTFVLTFVVALVLIPAAMASGRASMAPAVVVKSAQFGKVLATKGHLAFYTWTKERDHKVHCTGACAKAWPPVILAKGTRVAAHVAGVMGTFGTIVRPDGKTQLTHNGQPVYTFNEDTPTKILCDGVDGWFVVRV